MGKAPYLYTDSDETEMTSSSVENVKKKKKLSILKYTGGNIKKKKCKLHSNSEPEESDDHRSGSSQRVKHKLRGILKNDRDEEYGSTDEDDVRPPQIFKSQDRCLVGRVPQPPGAKPGRGGGVAIVVRRNVRVSNVSRSNYRRGRRKVVRFTQTCGCSL